MKLLVHNFLCTKFIAGVTKGYPLMITAERVAKKEVEFNAPFLHRMVPRLDWDAFRHAATSIESDLPLPETLPSQWQEDEPLLRSIHHALLELDVEEGTLQCPESGKRFTIKEGIPNMLASAEMIET